MKENTTSKNIITFLLDADLVDSTGQAKRLILQNAVRLDSRVLTSTETVVDITRDHVVQIGKKRKTIGAVK